MKKVYTFTLKDEDLPSVEEKSDINLIAYWLADTLENMSDEQRPILVSNKFLLDNPISDKVINNITGYSLESENDTQHYYNYNPTIIDERTFGITVYEERITDKEMLELLNQTLKEIGAFKEARITNKSFIMETYRYKAENKDDETNRRKVLQEIKKHLNKKVRIKKRPLLTKILASNIFLRDD